MGKHYISRKCESKQITSEDVDILLLVIRSHLANSSKQLEKETLSMKILPDENKNFRSNIIGISKNFLANGDFKNAVENLLLFIENNNLHEINKEQFRDKIILLNNQYKLLLNDQIKGILEQEYIRVERNRINSNLLETINLIDNQFHENNFSSKNSILLPPFYDFHRTKKNDENKNDKRIIEIKIDTDFHSFSLEDQQRLFNAISELLKIDKSEIVLKKKEEGSVKIQLELPEDNVIKLERLINLGLLSKHKVISSRIVGKELSGKTLITPNEVAVLESDINLKDSIKHHLQQKSLDLIPFKRIEDVFSYLKEDERRFGVLPYVKSNFEYWKNSVSKSADLNAEIIAKEVLNQDRLTSKQFDKHLFFESKYNNKEYYLNETVVWSLRLKDRPGAIHSIVNIFKKYNIDILTTEAMSLSHNEFVDFNALLSIKSFYSYLKSLEELTPKIIKFKNMHWDI